MFAAGLAASLDRIGQVQAHLPASLGMLMAVVGIGATLVPGVWQVARPISTMAHEGAHATMGSAVGRKITKMKFAFDGTGATEHAGDTATLVRFPVTFIGYLGPSAFGIGAAELIRAGHMVAVLWIGLICLLPVLYLARKSVGIVMVIAASVLLLVLLGAGSVATQVVSAYAVAWFLLASGVRSVIDDGKAAGDARTLREMTGIPRAFWPMLWLAGSVTALIFGATLLV